MRVLYFYQYFTTPKGAWSTRVYELARRWAAAGDEVTVVTSLYDKSDLEPDGWLTRFEIDGIDVRLLNIRLSNKHGVLARLFSFALYAVAASWFALTKRADVVISSSGPITVALPGLVAHYLRRRPFVFEVRDLWPEGAIQLGILTNPLAIRLARWFERRCYVAAHTVVTASEGQREWIGRATGISHFAVVPNASDNELADATATDGEWPEWTKGQRLVLYTGTLGLIDDCGQILEMAAILRESGREDVTFVLLGDGKERKELEARAGREGLGNVHFMGNRSKREVMRWLKMADVALFICKDVEFLATASPNKLFDAFACGVAVVQNSPGWIHDLFVREGCGLSVPPADARALAEGVARLLDDEALRTRCAEQSKRLGVEVFDRTLLARKMRGVLEEAAR